LPKPAEPLAVAADQSGWLHDHQSASPVEESAEPNQNDSRRVVSTPGFDLVFLIRSQLFAQKEIFCCEDGRRAQTQNEEAHGIEQKRHKRRCHLPQVVSEGTKAQHNDLISLRQQRLSSPIAPSLIGRVQGELVH
jgi:hypothetical protein